MENHNNNGFSDEELGFNLLTNHNNHEPGTGMAHPQQQSRIPTIPDDSDSDVSAPRYNPNNQSHDRDIDSTPGSPPIHYNNNNSDNESTISSFNSFHHDADAELLEKRKILTKLRRYELRKGIKLNTPVSIHTPLEDLQMEQELIQKELKMDQAVDYGKKFITMFAWGIEIVNQKYDPLDVYLDGWSASVNEEIDSYDEILEELYDKYYSTIDASPEVRLIMGLVVSAITYNISHKMLDPKNSTFLSKIAQNHNSKQMDSVLTGPSGGIADEILQEDLNALHRINATKKPLVRFE